MTTGLLSVFSHLNEYEPAVKGPLLLILENLRNTVTEEKAPCVHRTVLQMLNKIT